MPSIYNLGMGEPDHPDMGGGYGTITGGGLDPEEEKKGWMDYLYSLMGGDTPAEATAWSQPDRKEATGIPGLLAMGNYRASGRKPTERTPLRNHKYIQSLMGG